jgi:hypothetical protein
MAILSEDHTYYFQYLNPTRLVRSNLYIERCYLLQASGSVIYLDLEN